jgi:hypothetical protein
MLIFPINCSCLIFTSFMEKCTPPALTNVDLVSFWQMAMSSIISIFNITWPAPPLLRLGSSSAQVCSGLLTLLIHLIRNRQLLTGGLKGTPSTQPGVRILSPLYIPRQLSQSTCLYTKFKNAYIQGRFLCYTLACFTFPYKLYHLSNWRIQSIQADLILVGFLYRNIISSKIKCS